MECQIGVPKGIRTPVAAVKGRCPRPLDDGDKKLEAEQISYIQLAQSATNTFNWASLTNILNDIDIVYPLPANVNTLLLTLTKWQNGKYRFT